MSDKQANPNVTAFYRKYFERSAEADKAQPYKCPQEVMNVIADQAKEIIALKDRIGELT